MYSVTSRNSFIRMAHFHSMVVRANAQAYYQSHPQPHPPSSAGTHTAGSTLNASTGTATTSASTHPPPPAPIFILVGNKCDREHEREVHPEEGISLANSLGCTFVETSAKTTQNVDYVFAILIESLREQARKERYERKGKGGKSFWARLGCMG